MIVLTFVIFATPADAQTLSLLHTFTGGDGAVPYAGLTIDQAGNFYGTTFGGGATGHGTVFKLTHSGSAWGRSGWPPFAVRASEAAISANRAELEDLDLIATTERTPEGG